MHPIFIELKDVTGITLMINLQNVNYIRPTFGVGPWWRTVSGC